MMSEVANPVVPRPYPYSFGSVRAKVDSGACAPSTLTPNRPAVRKTGPSAGERIIVAQLPEGEGDHEKDAEGDDRPRPRVHEPAFEAQQAEAPGEADQGE